VFLCNNDTEAFQALMKLKMTCQTIIFVQPDEDASELAKRFNEGGFACESFGSRLDLAEPADLIQRARAGQVKVLVTTDVLSRGFDCPSVFFVVNWTPPRTSQFSRGVYHLDHVTYYHRAGRFGPRGSV
jgi:superfamily II DNA/RNA helicase